MLNLAPQQPCWLILLFPAHEILPQVKERIAREEAKGEATRKQQAMWDRLLEVRILLQRSLTASRQLPLPAHLETAKMVV